MIDESDIRDWMQDRPDPNLLPLMAKYVPLVRVRDVAKLADITGGGRGPLPLPTVAEQTARALAARWNEFDEQVAQEVLQNLPRTDLYRADPELDEQADDLCMANYYSGGSRQMK